MTIMTIITMTIITFSPGVAHDAWVTTSVAGRLGVTIRIVIVVVVVVVVIVVIVVVVVVVVVVVGGVYYCHCRCCCRKTWGHHKDCRKSPCNLSTAPHTLLRPSQQQ